MDEIVVTGREPREGYGWWLRMPGSGFRSPGGFDPSSGFGTAGLPAVPIVPVAPPAPPPPPPVAAPPAAPPPSNVIPFPEIVVKGKKPPAPRPFYAPPSLPRMPSWLRASNAALLIAQVGTMWTDFLSQQRLDEQAAGLLLPYTGRPDTPLETIPEPEPIPEIIVTARRSDALRNALVLPPQPTFTPYDWPIEVSPSRAPLEVPLPGEVPLEISAPTRPARAPSRRTRPGQTPQEIPLPTPGPSIRFGQQTRIQTQPQPANPLTPGQPGVVGFTPGVISLPGPSVAPMPATNPKTRRRRKCKKCKEDKPRKVCYRKLVKEARMPKDDEEFQWVRIDCETGRELKPAPRLVR